MPETAVYRRLSRGIDLAVLPMPDRPVVALEIRLLAGYAYEKAGQLGVAHVVGEAISKGTALRDGRALNDAFDLIGAAHGVSTGRETIGFSGLCLPEFMDRLVALHGEIICTPTFPQEACEVAIELSLQALAALEDDPQELARKLICRQAYGQPLGRHVLGEEQTLSNLSRDTIVDHWRRCATPARMLAVVAGRVDPQAVADCFEKQFEAMEPAAPEGQSEAESLVLDFKAGRSHHMKELEQEQVGICFPGSDVRDDDYPVEQVLVAILAGGMSGRLFTEVREKLGLVYWVGAWSDHPRRGGMIHLGASTTPERVDKTYATLLRELDRLGEDLTDHEVQRAITVIVARTQTRGDVTRVRAAEMVNDLFFYGRCIPMQEKLAKIQAVTVADVRKYLAEHPRDALSVVTLGPRELGG